MKKLNGKTVCIIICALTTVLGAVGGYLLYRFVGCGSGACSLTAKPYLGAMFGAVFGLLVGTVICPQKKAES